METFGALFFTTMNFFFVTLCRAVGPYVVRVTLKVPGLL